jgi:hypothetical protein
LPVLDLARVPVATGSLRALSAAFTGPGDPLQAFHKGELPVIIDALDEGRLLSNEKRFQSFLEGTGGLLRWALIIVTVGANERDCACRAGDGATAAPPRG